MAIPTGPGKIIVTSKTASH